MPDPRAHYSTFEVKVNGMPLNAHPLNQITMITVEQNLHLPDAASISFRDVAPNPSESPLLLGLANRTDFLPIGADLEITMGHGESPAVVFKGEITALELTIDDDAAPRYSVRGYNRAHRLQRGRQSRTFLNVTDSDIATTIASESGLQGATDSTSEVFDYVAQNNQTNWEFLLERARRNGYELFVSGTTLHFRKPHLDGAATASAALGDNVRRLNLRVTSAGQVGGVTVQGWDPATKQAVVGRSRSGALTVKGDAPPQLGSELAGRFGTATMHVANHAVRTQSEATTVAQALADDLQGSVVQVEAEVIGSHDLTPGKLISLKALGTRFNGDYYVTSATHRVGDRQSYISQITVSGRRSNTLGELIGGMARATTHGAGAAVAVATVTNNRDDKNQGRVKVKFPWLNDIESDWARLAAPGAGGTRGMYWMPEVGDEVLVAFEHGDVNKAYVIGGLWNGQDAPPKDINTVVGESGTVNQRIIQSRTGHVIVLDDTEAKQQVSIKTQAGHKVTLDDADGQEKITIIDKSGNNSISIDTTSSKITITAQGDLELNALGDVKVSGTNISLNAKDSCAMQAQAGEAKVQGITTNVQGETTLSMKALEMSIQAETALQVQGTPIMLNS
jgi:phage protein D/phage baseplate assembly protein gpV